MNCSVTRTEIMLPEELLLHVDDVQLPVGGVPLEETQLMYTWSTEPNGFIIRLAADCMSETRAALLLGHTGPPDLPHVESLLPT